MTITDPYLGTTIVLAVFAVCYLFFTWFFYCLVYFGAGEYFHCVKPFADRTKCSEPWLLCRRINDFSSNAPCIYIQLDDAVVRLICCSWLMPLASRLLGMAVVPASEIQFASSREVILFCQSRDPIRVTLEEPLWELIPEPEVSVYCDGTVVTNMVPGE